MSSFYIAPDGSKLGWDEHLRVSELRKKFIDWLRGNEDVHWSLVRLYDDSPRILESVKSNSTCVLGTGKRRSHG